MVNFSLNLLAQGVPIGYILILVYFIAHSDFFLDPKL